MENLKTSNSRMTLKLTLPGIVKQISENEVEVTIPCGTGKLFDPRFEEEIIKQLGERDGAQFLDDHADKLTRAQVLAMIR
jgi:hypothetical protein